MIIKAKIKPNSKEFKIVKGKEWTIYVKSKPEQNKANLEIIKELSKKYGSCKIIRGKNSKNKTIYITTD